MLQSGAIGRSWVVTMWLMGSRADAPDLELVFTGAAKVAGAGGPRTHAFDLQVVGGSVHGMSRRSHGGFERPLPDGSGGKGRVDADDSALLGLE